MTATATKIGEKNNRNSENRRANKPLMEKRRRARINQSLAILKTLIVDSNKDKGQKPTKLEKADILELTVSHLQKLSTKKLSEQRKFEDGYTECTKVAAKFLEKCNFDRNTVERLVNFLKTRQDRKINKPKEEKGKMNLNYSIFSSDDSSSRCSSITDTSSYLHEDLTCKIKTENLSGGGNTNVNVVTRTVTLTPVSLCPSPNDYNLPVNSNNTNEHADHNSSYCDNSLQIPPVQITSIPTVMTQQQDFYYNQAEPLDYSQPLDLCKNRMYDTSVWRPW